MRLTRNTLFFYSYWLTVTVIFSLSLYWGWRSGFYEQMIYNFVAIYVVNSAMYFTVRSYEPGVGVLLASFLLIFTLFVLGYFVLVLFQ